MTTKTLIEKLLPKAKRVHFKALCALATAVMVVMILTALWSAAMGEGRLFTVAMIIALTAMAVARDCDEAAGNIFGR